MPVGNASRFGDVVRSMAGITIEILNTEAKGATGRPVPLLVDSHLNRAAAAAD